MVNCSLTWAASVEINVLSLSFIYYVVHLQSIQGIFLAGLFPWHLYFIGQYTQERDRADGERIRCDKGHAPCANSQWGLQAKRKRPATTLYVIFQLKAPDVLVLLDAVCVIYGMISLFSEDLLQSDWEITKITVTLYVTSQAKCRGLILLLVTNWFVK